MALSRVTFSSIFLGSDEPQRTIVNGYIFSLGAFSTVAVKNSDIGAPLLDIQKRTNTEIEPRVTVPTVDYNNAPISNLTELTIVLLEESVSRQNPFAGIETANLVSYAENNGGYSTIIFITDDDIGTLKATRFSGLDSTKTYWVGCFVTTS